MNKNQKLLVNICRILVGVLFIISGWIKANDSIGFGYKLGEYFEVFGMKFLEPFSTGMAYAISCSEIILGIFLLLGFWMEFTAWSLLLMIIFFTFLTFYSAYFNKVTDCGCFGDALHLKPWQSFQKDIVLLLLILGIFRGRKMITPIFSPGVTKFVLSSAITATFVYASYCLYYLPVVDFRPFKIGNDIKQQMTVPEGAPKDSMDMHFIYEKDGKQVDFNMNDLMKVKDLNTYKFVKTESKLVREGYHAPIHDFVINSRLGQKFTDTFLNQKGYRIMIVQYDLTKSDQNGQLDLNKLVKYIYKNALCPVWPLTASTDDKIVMYRNLNQVPYDFFTADGTLLKTIIRSNPGIVLLKDNVVINMWPSTHIPTREEFQAALK